MTVVTDALAAVCLLLGAFFSFSAGMGVVRFDSLLSRLHVVAKPQVLGLLLLLAGVALRLRDTGSASMLVLVAVFQLLTSPVAAHMVGRAGLRTGKVDPALLVYDDARPGGRPADDA
ncbi:monovalent cation/H(+) antiporter subunit G [Promicromonospora sp. NPDC050880]|uniref:monovalent cation/H(+) antiporter subunit G n=1 Tax=unclassified Promicromonospora TaxID=2647929 RepID=UPI0037A47345